MEIYQIALMVIGAITLVWLSYKVNGLEGFTREIWICPVTLTVLGHYPQYIYIKQMQININND